MNEYDNIWRRGMKLILQGALLDGVVSYSHEQFE